VQLICPRRLAIPFPKGAQTKRNSFAMGISESLTSYIIDSL
jgi:hypothetical protein